MSDYEDEDHSYDYYGTLEPKAAVIKETASVKGIALSLLAIALILTLAYGALHFFAPTWKPQYWGRQSVILDRSDFEVKPYYGGEKLKGYIIVITPEAANRWGRSTPIIQIKN